MSDPGRPNRDAPTFPRLTWDIGGDVGRRGRCRPLPILAAHGRPEQGRSTAIATPPAAEACPISHPPPAKCWQIPLILVGEGSTPPDLARDPTARVTAQSDRSLTDNPEGTCP